MGFWNSVIYIATSRAACRTLFSNLFRKSGCCAGSSGDDDGSDDGVRELPGARKGGRGARGGGGSLEGSFEELRSGSGSVGEAV